MSNMSLVQPMRLYNNKQSGARALIIATDSGSCEYPTLTDKPKKRHAQRQSSSKSKDEAKRQKVCNHETGPDCLCQRFNLSDLMKGKVD